MSSIPGLDVLPPAQRKLWPDLVHVRKEGFVLYGGTAIALYLGHRDSVDFDFFSHRTFQPDELIAKFPFLRGAELLQTQKDTLTVLTRRVGDSDQVKISFFGGLQFGRLNDPKTTADGVLQVASAEDLLSHKLKVLLQRVELKDYLDIDALLQSGLDLAHGAGGARALFSTFAPQEALKALTYFNDASLATLAEPLKRRLVTAAAKVSAIPAVAVKSTTLCEV